MRKIIVFILFAICLKISGQQINQSSNHYRNGDMLEKKQVSVEGFDLLFITIIKTFYQSC